MEIGAGAGHEITGAGAGHEITGAGAGHGTWQQGPNLLNTLRLCRSFADALESNPASVTMNCASAIKMKYFALFLIVFPH